MRGIAACFAMSFLTATGTALALDLPGRTLLEVETFVDAQSAIDRAKALSLEFPQAAVATKSGRFAVLVATVPSAQARGAAAELTAIGRTGPVQSVDGRSYGSIIFGPDPTKGRSSFSVGFPPAPAASEDAPYLQIGSRLSLTRAMELALRAQTAGPVAVFLTKAGTYAVARLPSPGFREVGASADSLRTVGSNYAELIWRSGAPTDPRLGTLIPSVGRGQQHAEPRAENTGPSQQAKAVSGTGFFVSTAGHVVTNAHVVQGCTQVIVVRPGVRPSRAMVVSVDTRNDLALIAGGPAPAGLPRIRTGIRVGEQVAVFGFPLAGLLTSKGNFTLGNVSALAGQRDDTGLIQVTAPVQVGNSGGALVDRSGNVAGVVVQKLDALRVAERTSDIPQNVNFAIGAHVLIGFLDANEVPYRVTGLESALDPPDIADRVKGYSVQIICERTLAAQ